MMNSEVLEKMKETYVAARVLSLLRWISCTIATWRWWSSGGEFGSKLYGSGILSVRRHLRAEIGNAGYGIVGAAGR